MYDYLEYIYTFYLHIVWLATGCPMSGVLHNVGCGWVWYKWKEPGGEWGYGIYLLKQTHDLMVWIVAENVSVV